MHVLRFCVTLETVFKKLLEGQELNSPSEGVKQVLNMEQVLARATYSTSDGYTRMGSARGFMMWPWGLGLQLAERASKRQDKVY